MLQRLSDANHKCSSYGMLLLSSHKLTKAQTLNPTLGYCLKSKSHKERVGECFHDFGL
jgi:hypothetical protein